MTIPFACPFCQHFTEVELRYAGQTGQCGNCGKPITIPTPEESSRQAIPPGASTRPSNAPKVEAAQPNRPLSLKPRNSRWPLPIYGAVAMLMAAGCLWLILDSAQGPNAVPAIARGGPAACEQQLEKIGQAFEAYYDEHGHFPAATFQAKPEAPTHSWRVEILPYLNEQSLAESVHTEEKWDSQGNLHWGKGRPTVYAATDDDTLVDVEVTYLAVVGDQAGMTTSKGRRKEEFTDGLDQTILLIETRGYGISWMEPADLPADTADWTINAKPVGIGSHHKHGGAHVLLANGEVRWLDESTPPEALHAMCTIDGGESIDVDRWLKK